MTRKLDSGNWLLRRIARLVFDASAHLLDAFRTEGKEPMICSEFVFRTYEEATDEDNDPYALEILSQMTGKPRQRFLRFRRSQRVVAAAPSVEVPAIHPGSLLARMQAAGETPETLSESASRMAAAVAPSEEYLDSLIERYLAESEGIKPATRAADEGGPEDSIDAVLDSARRFTAGLGDVGTRKAAAIHKLRGSDKGAGQTAPQLARIVADFVTPGDLLKSPSLRKVKTIQL